MLKHKTKTPVNIELNLGDVIVWRGSTYEVTQLIDGHAVWTKIPGDEAAGRLSCHGYPTPKNLNGHCWHRMPDGFSRDGKKPPIENDWKCCHCGRYGDFEGVIPDGHGPHYIGPGIPTFNGNMLYCPSNYEQISEE